MQTPYPPTYIAGQSGPGKRLAANEADVYMTWGEPLDSSNRLLDEMRALATIAGRRLRFSTSFIVILGDTKDAAWDRAQDMLDHIDPAVLSRHQQYYERFDSVGQRHLLTLMQDARATDFRLGPNLWAGLTQVLVGNSIALVGTPDQVADRLVEYVGIGFDTLLLRGFPHLETIEQLGRDVIPRVRQKMRYTARMSS